MAIRTPYPFRPAPLMPAQAYKTYRIVSRRDTTVRAACEAVGCEPWRRGWESKVDERVDCRSERRSLCPWMKKGMPACGRCQAHAIRTSGRTFTERKTADGITVFRFESGQRCFREHRTRPELYIVRGGDYRGNPRGERRTHKRPGDWLEDFSTHQDRLVQAIERG